MLNNLIISCIVCCPIKVGEDEESMLSVSQAEKFICFLHLSHNVQRAFCFCLQSFGRFVPICN